MKVLNRLFPYRFEMLLVSQTAVLFGSLVLPTDWFENYISPVLLLLNLLAGIVLASKKKRLVRFLFLLVAINLIILTDSILGISWFAEVQVVKLFSYFIFYGLVTFEIIEQVAKAQQVEKNVIMGLISGYLALGLLSFFLFYVIEYFQPNSYSNLVFDGSSEKATEKLLYFSYVTLLTIGYGEIVPVSELAQKAAILVALIGQFYIVILTAVVVGKYINQFQPGNED